MKEIIIWAPEHVPNYWIVNTVCPCIYKCKLKLYHVKQKPYISNIQESHRNSYPLIYHLDTWRPWAGVHLRWTDAKWERVLSSDRSTFQTALGHHRCHVLKAKEEKDHPDCYQHKVQKPASLVVCGRIIANSKGNPHICDSTKESEMYVQALEQNMLSFRWQEHPCSFQPNHTLCTWRPQAWVLCSVYCWWWFLFVLQIWGSCH